jgi:FixJ family two-component response regulator
MNGAAMRWYGRAPGAAVSPTGAHAPGKPAPIRRGYATPPQAKTIAVVDDDCSLRAGLGRLLNAHGYATRLYESAEAFLALGAACEADCLLVDVDLGGMSGIELCGRLAAGGRAVPTILMTGFDDDAMRRRTLATGCVAYLLKPFPGRTLIDAVAAAMAE